VAELNNTIAGVVLAGGRGSRMGPEPKVLIRLGEQTLLERAVQRAAPQVGCLLISSNLSAADLGNPTQPVLPDTVPGYLGPLAGVCAALEHLRQHERQALWLCSFAADTPWFPLDLVERLDTARRECDARLAVARSGGRSHPVFALWPVSILPEIRAALAAPTDLGAGRFQSRFPVAFADWPYAREGDPFFNLNTPEDLVRAPARLARDEGVVGSTREPLT